MAKRQRTRPGQRGSRPGRSVARPPSRPAGPNRPSVSLTAAEEARAAEIEAQILAEERAADAGRARAVERRRSESATGWAPRSRDGSLLAARAEAEYAYVVRDVRRIARVGGSLIAILALLFVLIDVAHVVRF